MYSLCYFVIYESIGGSVGRLTIIIGSLGNSVLADIDVVFGSTLHGPVDMVTVSVGESPVTVDDIVSVNAKIVGNESDAVGSGVSVVPVGAHVSIGVLVLVLVVVGDHGSVGHGRQVQADTEVLAVGQGVVVNGSQGLGGRFSKQYLGTKLNAKHIGLTEYLPGGIGIIDPIVGPGVESIVAHESSCAKTKKLTNKNT